VLERRSCKLGVGPRLIGDDQRQPRICASEPRKEIGHL
jgi:hypothetical protein